MPPHERHFLGWSECAANSVARWLHAQRESIATYSNGVLDFTTTLVIVPGAGARRQVLAALRKITQGPMIPPSMATPSQFMVNAFETPAGCVVAGPLERLFAISKALAKQHDLREQLLPAVRATSLAALAGPAKRLLAVIDRADDAHRSVQEIGRLDILSNSPTLANNWQLLGRLHQAMKHELQEMGTIVSMEMLERSEVIDLAATGWSPKCATLVLAGLPDFARNVSFATEYFARTAFKGHPVQVHALVLAPPSEAAKFDHLGVVIAGIHGFTSGPDIQDSMIEVASDPPDQASATVARYSQLTGALDTGDTCIVLADESLLPNISRAFAQHDRAVHSGGGTAFAKTEVGQCLQRLEQAVCGEQASQLIELTRVPAITHLIKADNAAVDGLDHEDESGTFPHKATQAPIQTLEKLMVDCKATSIEQLWMRLNATSATKNLARSLDAQFKDWFACMSPLANTHVQLGQRWKQLEQWLHRAFATNENPITARALTECVQTLRHAQESMAAQELGSAADALSFALLLCADLSVHAPAEAQSVDTVGWLETLFHPSEKFVLTGIFEGSLPSAAPVDCWFNESIRAAVGLPTRAARFARDAYLLSALVARARTTQTHVVGKSHAQVNAPRLAIIVGQLGSDGDPLKPSRLLLPQDELAIAKRILLLVPNDAEGDERKRVRPLSLNVTASTSAFAIKPQPSAIHASAIPSTISVTDFAVYIDNPYRYWLEKVLKLSAPELDHVELNAAEFGTLLHTAAQALDTPAIKQLDINHANYCAQCAQGIMQAAHDSAHKKFGGELTLPIRLALLELQNRLPALVEWHAAQLRMGWTMVASEWPSKHEDAVAMLDVDGAPQPIKFRVDRIDYHPEHGWRIIDYKSSDGGFVVQGKAAKVLRGDKWLDLQLPLYKLLLPQIAEHHDALVNLATATSDKIEVGVLSVPASNLEPAWCPLIGSIDSAIAEAKRIVREIRAGVFPDTGKDPSGKFDRVRRALCLPMFAEEFDEDQDNDQGDDQGNEGSAT